MLFEITRMDPVILMILFIGFGGKGVIESANVALLFNKIIIMASTQVGKKLKMQKKCKALTS